MVLKLERIKGLVKESFHGGVSQSYQAFCENALEKPFLGAGMLPWKQVIWGSVADIKHCISSMHSAFSMPAVTKPRSSRTFNMSSALKSFVQASQARGVNLDILPDPSKKSAFDRLIPNIFQPALKPFRPAMRFVYRHYRRLKVRQSATKFYI